MGSFSSSRPAVALAWVLGIALLVACPQLLPAALMAMGWLLTDPAGTIVLGAAFAATVVYCVATRSRGYGWRQAW